MLKKLSGNAGLRAPSLERSQINGLETRIEKMQERFNKDLGEIKESIYNE